MGLLSESELTDGQLGTVPTRRVPSYADTSRTSSYQTMQQIVYENLRRAILQGEIRPGAVISAEQVAVERGFSRTPVREALRRLEMEGLIVMRPHQRAVVTELSKEDLREIYSLRLILEPLAARMAAENGTPEEFAEAEALWDQMVEAVARGDASTTADLNHELHRILYGASKHRRLTSTILALRDCHQPYLRVYVSMPGHLARMVRERRALLEACKARDGERAARLVTETLTRNEEEMLNFLWPRATASTEVDSNGHRQAGG